MKTEFRNYTNKMRFTEDYCKVRDFLVQINKKEPTAPNFLWGRWEWKFSLDFFDEENNHRIGIWQDGDKIVGLAAYESYLGEAFLITDKKYSYIKEEMILYAKEHLKKDDKLRIMISDDDRDMQRIANANGFRPTSDKESVCVLDIDNSINYKLPEGFKIVSLKDDFDIKKYGRVLYKGFDHEGDPPDTQEEYDSRKISLSGPNSNLDLKIAAIAPNGEFASYCGMWYDSKTENALVEPVATDPEYRKMGLAKAVVLEGVIRCGKLGAKRAYVGSSQQFYYNIGFDPIYTETWWKLVK